MTDEPASTSPERDLLPGRVESPRLVLRRWSHDEAAVLDSAITASVEHLRPWMPWVKFEPLTLTERAQLIEGWTRDWEGGGDVIYGVFLDGEAIGGSGLHRRSGPGTLDIGYWIRPDHTRQGFATELTTALTSAAFDLDGIEVVHVQTDEANQASAAVPAKLGFTKSQVVVGELEAPGESGRLIDWTMTSEAWAPRLTIQPPDHQPTSPQAHQFVSPQAPGDGVVRDTNLLPDMRRHKRPATA